MRRIAQSLSRYTLAAMTNLQAMWRWIQSFFGSHPQKHEVISAIIGIIGMIVAQVDVIRDFLPVHVLVQLYAWTGAAFGVCGASFIFKAWWYLQKSDDDKDQMKEGASYTAAGILFLLVAVNFGVNLPFTG